VNQTELGYGNERDSRRRGAGTGSGSGFDFVLTLNEVKHWFPSDFQNEAGRIMFLCDGSIASKSSVSAIPS
jgi:hypothetical protein